MSGSSVTYYKYTVRALFGFEGATWRNISSIDTIHGQGFPTVSQALNDVVSLMVILIVYAHT